jgi:nitrate reductase alpha subunit
LLEAKAKEGIPALMMSRTTPKSVGYEQITDSSPWYTKTGRSSSTATRTSSSSAGENLPVHREPVDSTFYEPNVIVGAQARGNPAPGPEDYGVEARRPDPARSAQRPQRRPDLGGGEARSTRS